jgi:hypothetical protein
VSCLTACLNYNYFRDYDPSVGRYVESDPIGLLGGVNPFAYASSSPILSSDLLGLAPGGWIFRWIPEKLRDYFLKKKPGEFGGDIGAQGLGRLKGAECAKNCQAFKAPHQTPEDIAYGICAALIPTAQMHPQGFETLKECKDTCLRLLSENCSPQTCPVR